MTREEVRQAVVALVEARRAAWSSYSLVVEYDNRILVDTKTQTNPFLCVSIAYISGEQVNLAGASHRVYGQLHISAAVRENEGSAKANELLDFFVPSLHMRSSGNLRLWGSSPVKERPHLGWVYYPVIVPFEADTLYDIAANVRVSLPSFVVQPSSSVYTPLKQRSPPHGTRKHLAHPDALHPGDRARHDPHRRQQL